MNFRLAVELCATDSNRPSPHQRLWSIWTFWNLCSGWGRPRGGGDRNAGLRLRPDHPTLSSITAQTATATIQSAPPFADTLQQNLEFWLKPESKFTIHVVYIVSSYASTSVIMAVIMNRMWEFAQRRRATVLPAASQTMARSIPIMLSLPHLWRLFKASATWGPSWIGALARYLLPASSLTKDTLTDAYPGMFRCICISQLVETFVSLIQGQVPYSESNMSLIEYSLSFHEAAQLKEPVPEIIVICLMGLVSHVFIHLLAIFKLNRYRLIPSALVGLSFLAFFQVQAMKGRLLNFPLILVLGFMPQVIYTYVIFSTVVMEVATMLMTGKRVPSILFERVSLSQDFYTWFEVVSNNVTKSASKTDTLTPDTWRRLPRPGLTSSFGSSVIRTELENWEARRGTATKSLCPLMGSSS